MDQTNAVLTHVIGKESKIVVRKSSEVTQSDFFFSQYRHAIKVTEKIVENADASSKETTQFENVNNIIAFIGDRGSGKTSCMLTFANILVEGHVVIKFESKNLKTDFYQLPAIDPSFFSEDYNIIGSYIATIYRTYQMLSKSNQNNEKIEQGKVHDFYKALADAQRSFGRLSAPDKDRNDDMERLEQLSCSMKLKEDIKVLTDSFLDCAGHSNGTILLCIDDIDLNTNTAVDMVEWIRKYLIQPNIIILFAVKLDQLINLKRLKLFSEYKDLLDNKKISESELDEMSERYLAKLIPLSNRVYMPDMKDTLNLKYEVISSDDSVSRYKSGKYLRDAVVELIFEKTRYLFYNSATTTSLIVPRNLREVLHLMRLLFDMKPIEGETNSDGTNSQERGLSLSENQTLFREYVFNDFLYKHLNTDSRQYIDGILSVEEPTNFNATVLRMLSKKFPNHTSFNLPISSKIRGNIEISIPRIMDKKNITYNISTGDVLGTTNIIDSMYCTDEEKYFLFTVKFIYSIKMYEYYNNIFSVNFADIAVRENEGKLAYSHTQKELKGTSDYHKLIAGHLFNSYLVNFIPNKRERLDGILQLKPIKELIDGGFNNYRLIEFLMLCTSGPKINNDTIKQKKRVLYSQAFNSQAQSAIFDLFSFFYNITNIEQCYRRFEEVFSVEYIKRILESNDTLWSDFYKAANFTIKSDEDGNSLRIRDIIINDLDAFNTAFKNLIPKNHSQDGSYNITIDDPEYKHNWLSWCCIRNTDVYEDFSYYLDGERNRSVGIDFIKKTIGFFTSVLKYQQATHDFIYDDKPLHYKLNFTYVGIILNFLNGLENISIKDYIVTIGNKANTIESEEENEISEHNGKTEKQEIPVLTKNEWNQILFRIFYRGAKNHSTIATKLESLRRELHSDIYEFISIALSSFQGRQLTKEELTAKIKESDTQGKIIISF